MRHVCIVCALILVLSGCSEAPVDANTMSNIEIAGQNDIFMPSNIPSFETYRSASTDESPLDQEFKIYKKYDDKSIFKDDEIKNIRQKETVIEPGKVFSITRNVHIYDKDFVQVGEAFPGTYMLIGYFDKWMHIVDKYSQAAWVSREDLDNAVSENILKDAHIRSIDAMDADEATYDIETLSWTSDITVLKDSICYIFPEGDYVFRNPGKNITIRYKGTESTYNLTKDGLSIHLFNDTEVYSDFGTEVTADATVSANMVSE